MVEEALLDFLYEKNVRVAVKDVYEPLAQRLELTEEEQKRRMPPPSANEIGWENLVRQARRRLVGYGHIDNSVSGFWFLTDNGKEKAAKRLSQQAIISSSDFMQDGTEAFIEAFEGRQNLRTHLIRERSQALVDTFKNSLKSFSCYTCGFDFEHHYGNLGAGYIEAHHTIPVRSLVAGARTKISDLVPLCANCHRIIHRNNIMPVEDLKTFLMKRGKKK